MIDEKEWEEWKREMDPILVSKVEEWRLYGYEKVTKDDLWECFKAKLPRLEVPVPMRPSWLVAELFILKVNDYMNWLTLQAYKGPDLFEDDEPIDFEIHKGEE